jgi:hypothetical protein
LQAAHSETRRAAAVAFELWFLPDKLLRAGQISDQYQSLFSKLPFLQDTKHDLYRGILAFLEEDGSK